MVVKFNGQVIARLEGTLPVEEIRTACAVKKPEVASASYKIEGDTLEFFTKAGTNGKK
jgi:hypothetical protein